MTKPLLSLDEEIKVVRHAIKYFFPHGMCPNLEEAVDPVLRDKHASLDWYVRDNLASRWMNSKGRRLIKEALGISKWDENGVGFLACLPSAFSEEGKAARLKCLRKILKNLQAQKRALKAAKPIAGKKAATPRRGRR